MVKELFILFSENSIMFIAFLVVLLFLLIFEKNSSVRSLVLFPSIVVILIVLTPLVLEIAVKFMTVARVVRLYWLFPVTVVLAHVCVKFIERYEYKSFRYMMISCTLVLVIMIMGKYMFSEQNFTESENVYKLPDETIAVCEAIAEDGYAGRLVPSIVTVATIRQYDSNIKLAFGRNSRGIYKDIGDVMNSSVIEAQEVKRYFVKEDYGYILVDKSKDIHGEFEDMGFVLLLETENHWLFKYVE